jgi:hypothetical protein
MRSALMTTPLVLTLAPVRLLPRPRSLRGRRWQYVGTTALKRRSISAKAEYEY